MNQERQTYESILGGDLEVGVKGVPGVSIDSNCNVLSLNGTIVQSLRVTRFFLLLYTKKAVARSRMISTAMPTPTPTATGDLRAALDRH